MLLSSRWSQEASADCEIQQWQGSIEFLEFQEFQAPCTCHSRPSTRNARRGAGQFDWECVDLTMFLVLCVGQPDQQGALWGWLVYATQLYRSYPRTRHPATGRVLFDKVKAPFRATLFTRDLGATSRSAKRLHKSTFQRPLEENS